jgi:hypothetical protein
MDETTSSMTSPVVATESAVRGVINAVWRK